MNAGIDRAENPTQEHTDGPGRAGRTHRWFMADSPAGPVFVAHANGRVSGLQITPDGREPDPGRFVDYMRDEVGRDVEPDHDPRLMDRVSEALATGRTDVPVDLSSRSPFHQEVLRAAARIPRGEVRTYGELAAGVGRPRAARAVGTAMARNPVPLLVPCHRVVPGRGGVGNYGFGPDLKSKLLANEGVVL
jgi:methylated-DNA-[protein]-cysteine S-methyltransferase